MAIPTVNAVVRQIADLAGIVERLDDDTYVERMSGASGAIGAHVRHSLDHIAAFVDALTTGECWYDRRVRGTDVERHRGSAVRTARALRLALLEVDATELTRRIHVHIQLDPSGSDVAIESTVKRELAFLLSHTVHHNAIIALLLEQAGIAAPHRFGVAASTPAPALVS